MFRRNVLPSSSGLLAHKLMHNYEVEDRIFLPTLGSNYKTTRRNNLEDLLPQLSRGEA